MKQQRHVIHGSQLARREPDHATCDA
jgi:hypothetical protein